MCLTCAIPVRGTTVGSECISIALGPDVPVPEPPPRDVGGMVRAWQRLAAAAAVIATLLPWSRFGAGSEPFGAWSEAFRWSMVAAIAAAVAFVVVVARDVRRSSAVSWDVVVAVAAVTVVVGSALAIARPPAFTSPWLGPWVCAAAGAVVLATSAIVRRGARSSNATRV
jgi:hypothetical protein